jgi:hypothetical protein
MATIEEILADADTGRYSTNQNTNFGNNTFGSNRVLIQTMVLLMLQ